MSENEGIEVFEEKLYNCQVTTVQIQSEQAAEQLQKSIGSYITIETETDLDTLDRIEDVGECLVEVLNRVMRPYYHGKLCICGLGNRAVPADALGPEVTCNLPLKVFSEVGKCGNFSEVVSLEPGISFTNNIDTEQIIKGVVQTIGADCILLADSLITPNPSRLFRTIQLSTAGGISPHLSGRKIDWSVLDIPVISIGVPLAIPISSLLPTHESDVFLTSTRVQDIVSGAGRIIAYAILRMCWPAQSKAECYVCSGLNKNPIPSSFLLEEE